ncbi:hypothetical protein DFH06DRAFT_1374939 [Mycena polygramma]|nr:hypothetical protein DFH06DRAFT_1374939 [Mycena polygramma]
MRVGWRDSRKLGPANLITDARLPRRLTLFALDLFALLQLLSLVNNNAASHEDCNESGRGGMNSLQARRDETGMTTPTRTVRAVRGEGGGGRGLEVKWQWLGIRMTPATIEGLERTSNGTDDKYLQYVCRPRMAVPYRGDRCAAYRSTEAAPPSTAPPFACLPTSLRVDRCPPIEAHIRAIRTCNTASAADSARRHCCIPAPRLSLRPQLTISSTRPDTRSRTLPAAPVHLSFRPQTHNQRDALEMPLPLAVGVQ